MQKLQQNPPNLNPLLNHLILEQVMEKMDWKDHLNCRLVCSIWDEVALHRFVASRSIFSPQLSQLNFSNFTLHFLHLRIQLTSSLPTEMTTLDAFWNNCSMLQSLRLEITTDYASKRLRWILQRLHNLEELSLIISQFWGHKEAHANIQDGTDLDFVNPHLHSIKYINLTSIQMYGESSPQYELPLQFHKLFSFYPALKTLRLLGITVEEVTELVLTLQVLGSNLKNLEILSENMYCEALDSSHLEALSSAQLQSFDELHLELSYRLDPSALYIFLKQSSVSDIKSLKLRRYPLPTLPPLQLDVPLRNLHILHISQDITENLNFLCNFPSLNTLHITLRDLQTLVPTRIFSNTTASFNHQSLRHVLIESPLMDKECIEILVRICPLLTSLTLRVEDEMLWKLSESCPPCLTSLHIISYNGLTDYGLTGRIEGTRVHPQIGLLKGLKRFTIEMWNDCTNRVTDESIYFGILELSALEELKVIRGHITQRALEFLPKATQWRLVE